MITAPERVQSVTIVERRSGPGYRLVLCRMTARGTPVLETLADSFASVDSAERFALDSFGIDRGQVRTKLRTHA